MNETLTRSQLIQWAIDSFTGAPIRDGLVEDILEVLTTQIGTSEFAVHLKGNDVEVTDLSDNQVYRNTRHVRTDELVDTKNSVSPPAVQISDEWRNRSPRSLNNRFILQAFTGSRDLKAKESNGFSMLSQKVSLIGLTLLADVQLADGSYFRKGSVAYVRESMIVTQPWGKEALEAPGIEGKFMIVDQTFVEFVVPA